MININHFWKYFGFFFIFIFGIILQVISYTIKYWETEPTSELILGTRDFELSYPLALIQIHTTESSKKYLSFIFEKWSNHPLIQDGSFEISIVSKKNIEIETNFKINQFDCDFSNENDEKICLTFEGFSSFLSEETKANWFLKITDTTWVDLHNLRIYISRLHSIYNPKKHIVFKSQSILNNNQKIIGESSWLMSRAYIIYQINNNNKTSIINKFPNSQDNQIQSFFINKLFKNSFTWDDNHMLDAICQNCYEDILSNKHWEILPYCKNDQLYGKVNSIITIKISNNPSPNFELSKIINLAPNSILFYMNSNRTFLYLCYFKKPKRIYSYSINEITQRKQIIYLPK